MGRKKNQMKYNLLEYQLLTTDILDKDICSHIATDSKCPIRTPMLMENVRQTSWWLWTSPCTYHSLFIFKVSLLEKDCLSQQTDKLGNHWGCSVEICWAQSSSLPCEEFKARRTRHLYWDLRYLILLEVEFHNLQLPHYVGCALNLVLWEIHHIQVL